MHRIIWSSVGALLFAALGSTVSVTCTIYADDVLEEVWADGTRLFEKPSHMLQRAATAPGSHDGPQFNAVFNSNVQVLALKVFDWERGCGMGGVNVNCSSPSNDQASNQWKEVQCGQNGHCSDQLQWKVWSSQVTDRDDTWNGPVGWHTASFDDSTWPVADKSCHRQGLCGVRNHWILRRTRRSGNPTNSACIGSTYGSSRVSTGCSTAWCTSPDAHGGHDCWAGLRDERCTCSIGSAKETGRRGSWQGETTFHYTCCTDGTGTDGEECGNCCEDHIGGMILLIFVSICIASIATASGVACCYCAKCCCFEYRNQQHASQVPVGGYYQSPVVVGQAVGQPAQIGVAAQVAKLPENNPNMS